MADYASQRKSKASGGYKGPTEKKDVKKPIDCE